MRNFCKYRRKVRFIQNLASQLVQASGDAIDASFIPHAIQHAGMDTIRQKVTGPRHTSSFPNQLNYLFLCCCHVDKYIFIY